MPESVELGLQRIVTKLGKLVDRGTIDDPVACAYLRSVQQLLDDKQTFDPATTVQLQHLADILDRIADAPSRSPKTLAREEEAQG